MNTTFKSGALALILSAAVIAPAAAADTDQLARQTGAGAAATASIDMLAALKFNHEAGRDGQQTVVSARNMPNATDAVAAAHFNRNASAQEVQPVIASRGTVVASPASDAQLIASAGLSGGAAYTLDAVVAAKFAQDDDDNAN
jgi:hypothetical protein